MIYQRGGGRIKKDFLVDHMLGKLARWIRFLGYHVLYPNPAMNDSDIIEKCKKDDLILITRDRELSERYKKSILVKSTSTDEQVKEFVTICGYSPSSLMTVCSICDGNLVPVSNDDVKGKVPDGVLENASSFWICDSCNKVYWNGSHYTRIRKTLESIIGEKK